MWRILLQWKRSQRHIITLLKWTEHEGNRGNRRNTNSTHPIPQLYYKEPRRNNYLQSKWHDPSCENDAAYLVAPKSWSRAGGYHYLGNKAGTQFNRPMYVLAKIIKAVMGSVAKAEGSGLYMNALELSPTRTTLEKLDHPQSPIPLKTNNSTADGIMNKTIKQRQSKAMDKRFYWLQDRVKQGEFRVFWAPGKYNLADYSTKYH